jgi:hypothetical protein
MVNCVWEARKVMPRMAIPKSCWLSTCQDIKGNNFGMTGFGIKAE